MHPRGVIRRDVRAALAALARFSGARLISSWTQNVTLTPGDAPVYGVSTPREVSQPASASDVERQTDVVVHLARVGGDEIEDDLDDDEITCLRAIAGMKNTALKAVVNALHRGRRDGRLTLKVLQRRGYLARLENGRFCLTPFAYEAIQKRQ